MGSSADGIPLSMSDTSKIRYLYRKQPDTGLFVNEHGPFTFRQAAIAAINYLEFDGTEYEIGIDTSPDGRTVIAAVSEYPK